MYNYRARGLLDLLQQQGRKQRWLAEQAQVSESHLSRVITGERMVDEATARRIADALGLSSLFLVFEFTDRSESLPHPVLVADLVPA